MRFFRLLFFVSARGNRKCRLDRRVLSCLQVCRSLNSCLLLKLSYLRNYFYSFGINWCLHLLIFQSPTWESFQLFVIKLTLSRSPSDLAQWKHVWGSRLYRGIRKTVVKKLLQVSLPARYEKHDQTRLNWNSAQSSWVVIIRLDSYPTSTA